MEKGFIGELLKQIDIVGDSFAAALKGAEAIPVVAQITLRKEALAKSHRPSLLFTSETCPIIGTKGFGELLVSVDSTGLNRLRSEIKRSGRVVNFDRDIVCVVTPVHSGFDDAADEDTYTDGIEFWKRSHIFATLEQRDAMINARFAAAMKRRK